MLGNAELVHERLQAVHIRRLAVASDNKFDRRMLRQHERERMQQAFEVLLRVDARQKQNAG